MGACLSNKLEECTFENTQTYSLNGLITKCKILKVYDGDTLWLAIKIHGKYYKYKCRMDGYDSPEMKPPLKQKNRDKEIQLAKDAKSFLEKSLENKTIKVEFFNYCKYGRPLINLYAYNTQFKICGINFLEKDGIFINKLMIESGHGYEYHGGTKKELDEN